VPEDGSTTAEWRNEGSTGLFTKGPKGPGMPIGGARGKHNVELRKTTQPFQRIKSKETPVKLSNHLHLGIGSTTESDKSPLSPGGRTRGVNQKSESAKENARRPRTLLRKSWVGLNAGGTTSKNGTNPCGEKDNRVGWETGGIFSQTKRVTWMTESLKMPGAV